MASQQAIATKTVNAVRTIEKASTALASHLKIDITPFPVVPKRYDAEYARAVVLSHLADVLQKIALATKSAKEKDFEIAEPIIGVTETMEGDPGEGVQLGPEGAEPVHRKSESTKKSVAPKGKKK